MFWGEVRKHTGASKRDARKRVGAPRLDESFPSDLATPAKSAQAQEGNARDSAPPRHVRSGVDAETNYRSLQGDQRHSPPATGAARPSAGCRWWQVHGAEPISKSACPRIIEAGR